MTRVSRTKGYRRFYGDAGKGWIIVSNGKEDISIPIGTDGTLLKADSSTPSGLSWTDLAPEFMEYIGNWDASTNTPSLQDGSSNPDSAIGNVYRVNVAGTQNLGSGSLTFEIGDFVILNNAKVWERAPGAGAKVTSVNSQIGDVVLDTDDIAEGSNKYFSDTLAKDAVVVNSLAGSETDQSPSVSAVNSALGSIVIPQEIIEADDLASFPVSGEAEKVYVAKDTNKLYRWDGAAYQELSPSAGGVVEFDQEVYVSKNGNDGTADGSLSSPFLTVKAAMAAITDASPTKRYCIKVAAGTFVETGNFELKANVFVAGTDHVFVTRIQADSFVMASDFTGSGDHRSGFANCTLIGPCDFDWSAVTSAAGKLYFNNCSFGSTVDLTGHNNGIAQAQFWLTTHFGKFTVSGINLMTIANRFYAGCEMTQHPILATVWDAHGGSTGDMDIVTTVNQFSRRCSMFARSFLMENVLVDGPVSYCDYTASSLGLTNSTANGGQLIPMNPSATGANTQLSNLSFPTSVNSPIIPNSSSSINLADWGKQWAWSFSWISASTGSDKYLISYPSSFGADPGPGKNIYIITDGAGVAENVNSGNIGLSTAAVSGTGVRGRVTVDARELTMNNTKIVDLAAGTASTDAVNVGQLTSAFADRYRADSVALGDGVSTASVTFSSALATADYTITYSLVNTVDANPKFLDVIVTSKSTTGFSVKFHQNTDSANYLLEYICIVHS